MNTPIIAPQILIPKIQDFTIGADPEFMCTTGKKKRIIEANDGSNDAFGDETTPVGRDGCGTVFEIRPSPSKNPLKVVSNIYNLFVKFFDDNPEFYDYELHAGSYFRGYPLGGHIHFGIRDVSIAYPKNYYCTKILSQYLGLPYLIIGNRKQIIKRINGGYGSFNDVHDQVHGMEYRTLGSWLVSPHVSASVLCLAKTILYEAVNNPTFKFHTFIDIVARDYFQYSKFVPAGIRIAKDRFPDIWNDIVKMILYQKYKPYIDIIYFIINNNLTWFPTVGMKESWGLVNLEDKTGQVDLDVIWARFLQEPKELKV